MIKCEIEKEEVKTLHIKGGKGDLLIEATLLALVIIKEMAEGDKSQFKRFKKDIIRALKAVKYEDVIENETCEVGITEKQKPTYKDDLYHCPNCGDKDLILVGDEACEKCGQVLDWSDIAEEGEQK